MNRINFKEVRMKNFLSIKDEVIFDFTKHKGLNYIFGTSKDSKDGTKNGVGKSVIFCDAVTFALFGKTSKDISKGNIPYRVIGKKCEVSITFDIGVDSYKITQGIGPTFIKLEHNDIDITKSSIIETQRFIESQILKTSYNIFKTSVILSINDTVNIFNLKAKDKREFIDSIFNLQQYGDMYIAICEDIKNVKSSIKNKTNDYTKLIAIIKDLNDNITRSIESNNKEQISIDEQKQSIDDDISIVKYSITTVPDNDFVNEEINLSKLYNELITNEKDLNKDLEHKRELFNHKKELVLKFKDALSICCEDCCKVIDTKFNISTTQTEMSEIVEYIKDIKSNESNRKETIIDVIEQLKKVRANLANIKEIEEYNIKMNARLLILEKQYDSIVPRKFIDISGFEHMKSKYTTESIDIGKDLAELTDKLKYLEASQYIVSPDGIKKWLLEKIINNFNTRIRQYLDELGAQYSIIFDSDLSAKFLTIAGECEYNNFSAGERKRIDHAISFALRDIIASQGNLNSSILICDEIIDISIDDITVETLLNILKRESLYQNVFLISHKENVSKSEIFDNIIELEKKDGQTRIIFDSALEKS